MSGYNEVRKRQALIKYAPIIETFINNPGLRLLDIGAIHGVTYNVVSLAVTKYYKKPKFDLLINSSIDSERAIKQESELKLLHEVYELITNS